MSEREKVYTRKHSIGNNAIDYTPKYGERVRKLEVVPELLVEPKVKIKNVYRTQPREDANFIKINRACTIALAFVIIATLGICVVFLNSQLTYKELNREIETVKQDLNTLKRENVQLESDLVDMVDLEEIYLLATTEMNMRLPGPNDVYYISNDETTYTTKYAPVLVEKEETTFGSILGYIKRGW